MDELREKWRARNAKAIEQRDKLRDDNEYKNVKMWELVSDLRIYLSNPKNTRHRTEAERRIDSCYQGAIDKMTYLAAQDSSDEELLNVLVSLVKRIWKTGGYNSESERSLSICFISDVATNADKEIDDNGGMDNSGDGQGDHGNLKDMGASDKVIGVGRTFSLKGEEYRRYRIIEWLSHSFSSEIGWGLVDEFIMEEDVTKADIVIKYETYPTGNEIPLDVKVEKSIYDYNHYSNGTIVGYLKEYRCLWTVKVRPDSSVEILERTFTSEPYEGIIALDAREGDPPWAPYTVMMYSIAYDFTDQLLTSICFQTYPPSSPITFEDAFSDY
ncbi:MAG: hypothetical protein JW863_16815 [Chitinispirillaceae bacterium]|nr:hypothetical protein [Chitinispirillaceae bacterium]